MDSINNIFHWIWMVLSALGGYLMYQHKRLDKRIDNIESQVHRLDKASSVLVVEIREIKKDIEYIRSGMDKLIEKL